VIMRNALAWLSMVLTLGFAGASLASLFANASIVQMGSFSLVGVTMPLVVWAGLGFLALAVLLTLVILVTAAIG